MDEHSMLELCMFHVLYFLGLSYVIRGNIGPEFSTYSVVFDIWLSAKIEEATI